MPAERTVADEPRFPHLATIAMVETELERNAKIEPVRHYYLSSAKLDAKTFARAVRDHWHIENRLHWVLDVVFHDDLARLHSANGPENMAVAKHMAMTSCEDPRKNTASRSDENSLTSITNTSKALLRQNTALTRSDSPAAKFAINYVEEGQLAFFQVGYGGTPSNHSTIVSSAAALVAIRQGVNHPAFGVAVALAFVVMLDANSLRRQVGRHAEEINCLNADIGDRHPLRERMGHTRSEIAAGIAVGILSAWGDDLLFSLLA